MELGIIRSITEINNNINDIYRSSKKPKIIKEYIVTRNRNKLRKQIDKILSKDYLPAEILSEYIGYLYRTYPPFGQYESCRRISDIDEGTNKYAAIFEVVVPATLEKDKIDKAIAIISPTAESDHIDIRYSYTHDSKAKFTFSVTEKSLINYHAHDISPYPYTSEVEYDVVKSIICQAIMKDIKKYLYDMVERSERINL